MRASKAFLITLTSFLITFILLFGGSLLGAIRERQHQQDRQQQRQQQYIDEIGRCVAQRCGPMFSTEPPTDELLSKRVACAQECIRESKKRIDAVP